MRVIFTGGGTAGHINPALAIADFFRDKHPDWEFRYVGNPDHMEYKLAKAAGYQFIGVKVKGFQRKLNFRNIKNNIEAAGLLLASDRKSKKILRDFKPDIVIGTGGYVTGPIMNVAANMKIKTFTHEQNAYPGVTTRILSKKVTKVLLAVKEAEKYLDKNCNIEVTGNPIRKEILNMNKDQARKKLGVKNGAVCIVSFGGSLGARTINKAIAGLISKTYKSDNIHHIHAYGKFGSDEFPNFLKNNRINLNNIKNNGNIDIREYINNMDECLAAADIVICRAGAITVSEIEAVGKASILIPSPNVSENHQYYNAKVLADKKAAVLIEEKDLKDEILYKEIMKLVNNSNYILEMEKKAKQLAITDSCEKIYNIVMNS